MTHSGGPNLLDAALAFAGLGYPVFPCLPGTKRPLTAHGFKEATVDPEVIEAWWTATPAANIGVPTAGMLVIDVDGAENEWPGSSDRELDLAAAPSSMTPGGGHHFLFRAPSELRNTASRLAEKVDTRADGGYIVVPPSVIDGRPYRWVETRELDCGPDELPLPPEWVVRELEERSRPRGAPILNGSNSIPSGVRNATLTSLAGAMRRVGMDKAAILAALLATNETRCSPALEPGEVERIADSIMRYEPDQVSVAVAEHWADQGPAPEADEEPSVPDPGPMPDELLSVPGLIDEVMTHCLATAPYPNKAMAFAGALALQATLAGRKIRDAGGLRTNIYILALAGSGTGKQWPRDLNKEILRQVGMSSSQGESFASGEGLEDALYINPCMLFQVDEFQTVLAAINQSKDGRYQSLVANLLRLYSSARGSLGMRTRANEDEQRQIIQPCLTVFGTSIPRHFYESLSEKMLTDGLFARLIILESGPRGRGQDPTDCEVPKRILDMARWWTKFHATSMIANVMAPDPRVVPTSPEADDVFEAALERADAAYEEAEERGDSVAQAVWARLRENARKLALIHVASRAPTGIELAIDEAAAEWGTRFAEHQARRMLFMAAGHVAESTFDAHRLKLLRVLWEAPGGRLSRTVVYRRMKMPRRALDELIETLVEGAQVRVVTSLPDGGRPGTWYEVV